MTDQPAPEPPTAAAGAVRGVDALRLGARVAETVVPVCTRGDLVAEFGQLDMQLQQVLAERAGDPRLAGTASDLPERLAALREQIEAATVAFRLRALPRRAWQRLIDAHPPRQSADGVVHEDDRGINVNNETFFPALIAASTVEPTLKPETWTKLLAEDSELLNDEQYQRLGRACWNLNRKDVNVPFSFAGSLLSRTSSTASAPPDSSASASSG